MEWEEEKTIELEQLKYTIISDVYDHSSTDTIVHNLLTPRNCDSFPHVILYSFSKNNDQLDVQVQCLHSHCYECNQQEVVQEGGKGRAQSWHGCPMQSNDESKVDTQ